MYQNSSQLDSPNQSVGGGQPSFSYNTPQPASSHQNYSSNYPSVTPAPVSQVSQQQIPVSYQIQRQKSRDADNYIQQSYSNPKSDFDTGYSNRDSGYSTTSFISNDSNYGYNSPYQTTPQQNSPNYQPAQQQNSPQYQPSYQQNSPQYPYQSQQQNSSDYQQNSPQYQPAQQNSPQYPYTPPSRPGVSDFTSPPISDFTSPEQGIRQMSISDNSSNYSKPVMSYDSNPMYEETYMSAKPQTPQTPVQSPWTTSYSAEPSYVDNAFKLKRETPTTPKYEASVPFSGYERQPSLQEQASQSPATPQYRPVQPTFIGRSQPQYEQSQNYQSPTSYNQPNIYGSQSGPTPYTPQSAPTHYSPQVSYESPAQQNQEVSQTTAESDTQETSAAPAPPAPPPPPIGYQAPKAPPAPEGPPPPPAPPPPPIGGMGRPAPGVDSSEVSIYLSI